MIKKIRLQDFKAFRDSGELNLKPLTVLAGPNSGGKSSLLQSFLLLKQTLDAPSDVQLSLDGNFLQFSNFNELVFNKPSLSKCKLQFTFGLETSMSTDRFTGTFPKVQLPANHEGNGEVAFSNEIGLSFRHFNRGDNAGVKIDRFHVTTNLDRTGKAWRLAGNYRTGKYKASTTGEEVPMPEFYRLERIQDVVFRNFLPQILLQDAQDSESQHYTGMPLHPVFQTPVFELWQELSENLEYLGPLRERPQRAYLHSGNPMTKIGDSGEYAAQILWLERDRIVEYLPSLGMETREVTLLEAVNESFTNLGLFQNVDVKSRESIMYQILFRLGGQRTRKIVTIADVGFGVSQLLPILVLGLRSHPSSLLLLEQPEIHLHPKLQANLADFLLTLSARGRRLIVETHSDHFINRLRRRIAEDPHDELKNEVSILFVHPPRNGAGATIEPLAVDRFGVIENWPEDFLPESADEAEAIFVAGLRKRVG